MRRNLLLLFAAEKITKAWSTVFNGTTTSIDAGTEASVDDLHDGAMTIEAWLSGDNSGAPIYFFSKGGEGAGWSFLGASGWLTCNVYCATTNATLNVYLPLGAEKHHCAITFDDAGDRKVRLFVDGALVGTSDAGVGAVVSDAAYSLYLGAFRNIAYFLSGLFGWCRVSNSVRYTTTFTPPSRLVYPAVDANTVRLFKMNEGSGAAIIDYSANAQNATLANGTWVKE